MNMYYKYYKNTIIVSTVIIALLAMSTTSEAVSKRYFNKITKPVEIQVQLHNFAKAHVEALKLRDIKYKVTDKQKLAILSLVVESSLGMNKYEQARSELKKFAKDNKLDNLQLLTSSLQVAGTYGAAGDIPRMKKDVSKILTQTKLDTGEKMQSLWQAVGIFRNSHNAKTALYLLEQAKQLHSESSKTKIYDTRFRTDIPDGPAAWANWSYAQNPKNQDARFRPYSSKAAQKLVTDVNADRATANNDKSANKDKVKTYFVMAYDARAWYIYVFCEEPKAKQIMAEGGKAAGSLEMYFTPALSGKTYYQWIVRLGTGKTSIYPWDTAHPGYQNLEQGKNSFHTQTAVLDNGFGTLITIPWASQYSNLPLSENKPWKFSVIRWTSHGSVTWGGKIHETGRWGHIRFDSPTTKERTSIRRYMIQQAWSKYEARKKKLSAFWQSNSGDKQFYAEKVQPLIEQYDGYGKDIKNIYTWSAKDINDTFKSLVPKWINVKYKIADLRKAYLEKKLLN